MYNEGAKLLLSYDVIPDRLNDYFRFFMGRYIPTMQAMGLEICEAWQTAYGDFPDRLIGFISPSRDRALGLVQNNTWNDLNEELLQYVTGLSYKVIAYHEGFQF